MRPAGYGVLPGNGPGNYGNASGREPPLEDRSSLKGDRRTDLLRWFILAAIIVAAGMFLYAVRGMLAPFALAAVVTYVLAPGVDYLGRLGLRRTWSILLIYGFLALTGGLVLVFLLPALASEVDRLIASIPGFTAQVQGFVRDLQENYSRIELPSSIRKVIDDTISGTERTLVQLLEMTAAGLVNLLTAIPSLLLAPVLAFYILADLDRLKLSGMNLIPRSVRGEWLSLLGEIDEIISGFVGGLLLVAAVVGTMVTVAMTLLGMPFAVLLGIVAGVTEIIPYFGPVLGALPALAVALLRGPVLALEVGVAFIIIQQVENAVVAPRIMGARLRLHPLVIIFALLAGGQLFGIAGLLLAVPAAGVLRVLGSYLVRRLTARSLPVADRETRGPEGESGGAVQSTQTQTVGAGSGDCGRGTRRRVVRKGAWGSGIKVFFVERETGSGRLRPR